MPCCPQAALAHGRRRPNVAVLLFACLATVTRAAENSGLLQALEAASSEEAAKALLDPHLDSLKELDREVIEKVVLRQWWGLARDIVARSHLQQVDLSFSVRKAVRTLKDEADELLRTLNPKYGLAQQVSPAFQWAQNDTCIFLTIKYTVRWNAPGALEVTEPSVNITDNIFNFTGLGKHSNNKYKYWLTLNLFDRLSVAHSTWSMASVGKMSATLRKRWPRKWPRLLLDKKQKIGNMHVWMEMQDKLDSSLSGMSSATNSPMTCMQAEKLYCLPTDTCKKSVNCSTCPGKNTPHEEEGVCTGMPSEKASVSFKDADMDANEIGGDVKISKARNEFDIERYVLYFGKDDHTPIEYENGARAVLGEARPTGFDTEVAVEQNTKIPAEATHLLVYSKNAFGEYPSPGSTVLRDAVLPKGKPGPITFEDDDGEKGEVSGVVRIARAENEDKLDDYSLHWGRSATRKTSSSSLIRDISKGSSGQTDIAHTISRSTRPPEGATHLLVFAKNEFGENPSPSSLKFVDNVKACLTPMDADCVVAVEVTADEDETASKAKATIKVVPAKEQVNMTAYVVYWGKKACEPGEFSTGVKNGLIKELPVSGPLEHQLVDAKVPPHTTHIVAFSKNRYGESLFCVSVPFQDVKPAPAEPEDKKAEL